MNFVKKSIAVVIASVVIAAPIQAEAAFGGSRASSSGAGISRSTITRPSAPSKTYSAPSRSRSYNQQRVEERRYNNNSYSNNSQPSFGSQVASTALGVGAGILAAEAISNLIAGPNGTYTHPQHPGVVYNSQGVPQNAVNEQAAVIPQPQQVVVVKDSNGGFFSFLWGMLGNILHLALFLGVVGTLSFGGWKLFKYLKRNKETLMSDFDDLEKDIDFRAQELFYNFQKNANNKEWIEQNSKYLPVEEIVSQACDVVRYEHNVVDVSAEAGKIQASVKYNAVVKESGNVFAADEHVNQYWHFELNGSKWVLVGVEPV